MKITLLIIISLYSFAEDATVFREQYDLNSGAHEGNVEISVSTNKIIVNENFRVDMRFTCKITESFYNPFFQGLIPLPGKLELFNDKKEYVGNLLWHRGGSSRTIDKHDWFTIPSECHIGATLSALPKFLITVTDNKLQQVIKPGHYYLQLIIDHSFIMPNVYETASGPSKSDIEANEEIYKNYNSNELFRSNIIEIEFINKPVDDQGVVK